MDRKEKERAIRNLDVVLSAFVAAVYPTLPHGASNVAVCDTRTLSTFALPRVQHFHVADHC